MIVTHYARTSVRQKSEAEKMQGLQDSFLGLQANKWGIWTLKIYEPSIVGLISWDYNDKYNQQKMRSGSTHELLEVRYISHGAWLIFNGDIKLLTTKRTRQLGSGPKIVGELWTKIRNFRTLTVHHDSVYQTIQNIQNWVLIVVHMSQLDNRILWLWQSYSVYWVIHESQLDFLDFLGNSSWQVGLTSFMILSSDIGATHHLHCLGS